MAQQQEEELKKVVSVAVGEAHTLALTGDGSVYAWGRGTFGRLGTGKESDELVPIPVSFDLTKSGNPNPGFEQSGQSNPAKFVGIAAGSYHSLALQDDGSVWSWGYNTYGQLGSGEENSLIPIQIPELNPQNPKPHNKIISVRAGGMMSFAIDSTGSLFMWGHCPDLTLTDSDAFRQVSIYSPVLFQQFPTNHTITKLSCGTEHILALIMPAGGLSLVVYSWGGNSKGQLGVGDRVARNAPAGVVGEFGEVYDLACGGFHSAILSKEKKKDSDEIQYRCWTFGLGENGQLGHGTTNGSDLPVPIISLPTDIALISLDCGLFHTAVLSAEGQVWIWGMERGFGLCPINSNSISNSNPDLSGDALNPIRIQNNNGFLNPVQIGCGAAHTILVSNNGSKIWAWGRGSSGVLGTGDTNDSYTPGLVSWNNQENQEVQEKQENQEVKENQDLKDLRERMEVMERYANVLHVTIFGKRMDEGRVKEWVCKSGVFDLRREFEGVLGNVDDDEVARMERFYEGVLERVKEERLKRRVKEMVRESLRAEFRR